MLYILNIITVLYILLVMVVMGERAVYRSRGCGEEHAGQDHDPLVGLGAGEGHRVILAH